MTQFSQMTIQLLMLMRKILPRTTATLFREIEAHLLLGVVSIPGTRQILKLPKKSHVKAICPARK